MRLAIAFVFSVSFLGCSSDDSPGGPTGPNACVSAGFTCWDNPPLRCIGIYEDVDPSLKNACGKSVDGTSDVPCCKKVADPPDTGTVDTGTMDSASDGATDGATDAPSEASSDATADGG
jgi:hypothetical protein